MSRSCSLVIRTWNEAAMIDVTLDAVRRQTQPPEEVIVVDSGSTDDTVERARRHGCQIISIRRDEFTFGHALNIGCAASAGEFCAFLSAHAVPADDLWLESLLRPFADASVAGVYGRQLPWPDCDPFTRRDLAHGYPTQPRRQDADFTFSNANAAIPRSVWERIPFDSLLPANEDQVWAAAALQRRYVIAYEPAAAVYHSHNETFKQIFRRARREACADALLRRQARTSWIGFLRDCQGRIREDFVLLWRQRCRLRWFAWAPPYRVCRCYGVHRGTAAARRVLDADAGERRRMSP